MRLIEIVHLLYNSDYPFSVEWYRVSEVEHWKSPSKKKHQLSCIIYKGRRSHSGKSGRVRLRSRWGRAWLSGRYATAMLRAGRVAASRLPISLHDRILAQRHRSLRVVLTEIQVAGAEMMQSSGWIWGLMPADHIIHWRWDVISSAFEGSIRSRMDLVGSELHAERSSFHAEETVHVVITHWVSPI